MTEYTREQLNEIYTLLFEELKEMTRDNLGDIDALEDEAMAWGRKKALLRNFYERRDALRKNFEMDAPFTAMSRSHQQQWDTIDLGRVLPARRIELVVNNDRRSA